MAERMDKSSNTIQAKEFLSIQQELLEAQREIDKATGRKRAILKRAKNSGADLDALALLNRLAKLDDDVREGLIGNLQKYSSWQGTTIWTQADLPLDAVASAPAAEDKEKWDDARTYDSGYHAGADGANRDANPFEAGSSKYERWDVGYLDGQESIADKMGANAGVTTPSSKPRGRGRPPGSKKVVQTARAVDDSEVLPGNSTLN